MKQQRQIYSIQVLRGAAALLVVVHHACNFLVEHSFGGGYDFKIGAIGVDIFFIISGFIMYCSTLGHRGTLKETLAFWKKRIVRIVPLYWLITAFIVIASFAQPASASSAAVTLTGFVKSILFIPYVSTGGLMQPVVGQGWTLNYEIFFYAALGCVLLVSPRHMLVRVAAVFAIFQFSAWCASGKSVVLGFYASPMMLEFVAGVVLAKLYLRHQLPPQWLLNCGIVLGAFLLTRDQGFKAYFSSEWHRIAVWGVFSFILVAGLLRSESWWSSRAPRIMTFLGDASYSIYLSHVVAFSIFWKVLARLPVAHELPAAAVLVTLCLFATLFGSTLYWFVERGLTKIFSGSKHRLVIQI
ncbi:acyltransferase family protein [Paraburkholderia aspalathi]|uniref:Exopolysaccharide production protein ExoZ n=1 Tax=Paraburkholderia aspalathi TaxID=1324617 RepID=A0A1I7ELJ3_9BURK|nr:acyltransferase [Paraburkholderia aspalathi]SFU24814.1 exopolysaccharide production protein ExoZ [Paraburkholderia aspalathi]